MPKKLRSYQEFELYWQGAHEEARRCGFRLEEFRRTDFGTPARLKSILRARNIGGLLIPPHSAASNLNWGDFPWHDFCIVRFGHSVVHPRAHLVTSDQLTDGLIAFENFWSHGYRRIAYETTRETATKGTRFSTGFFQGQLKVRAKTKLPPLLLTDETIPPADQKTLADWLLKARPDAILTDISSLPTALARCGIQVPRDIGLAVTSVLDGNASAGIDQNSRETGKAAIQMLISLLNHHERGIAEICRELLIEGRWVPGATLPSQPAAPRKTPSPSHPSLALQSGNLTPLCEDFF